MDSYVVTPREAREMERPSDNLATPIVERHGVEIEYYAPRGVDMQTPHDRDELYVIATGTASFFSSSGKRNVTAGDLIFVPAQEAHRFEDIGADFAAWVVFFGPSKRSASGQG